MQSNLMLAEPIEGELVEAESLCPRCETLHESTDAYCRHCGSALSASAIATKPSAADGLQRPLPLQLPAWVGRRSVVIGLLLLVGPLGLPLLWISPKFSLPTKVITSLAYFGFTVLFPIALTWYWLDTAMQPLVEAFPSLTVPKP